MDKPKTKVVKSKSSNSAITSKSEPRKNNKKSRSNAEFQPLLLKKRGVYVEKKSTNTKISVNEGEISPVFQPQKPPSPKPIPRPGRKRFLNSVLNILSQSTTGTQYPDMDDPDRLKKSDRNKTRLRKKREEETIQEDTITPPNNSRKKQRYRSRILNANDSDLEQLVVLQSTKEITHTPSINSGKINVAKEHEVIKWADILPPLVKKNFDLDKTKDLRDTSKDKRVKLVDKDPSTLVAEVPKKDEKKLYNFFVDLLETTFNVYNVKTEVNPPLLVPSVNSSRVALEMDESVAKKLNIQKPKEFSRTILDDVHASQKSPSKYFYCIKPDPNEVWDDQHLLEHFKPKMSKQSRTISPPKSLKRKRRLQSESLDYKKPKPTIPATVSIDIPNKRILIKKERKKNFINLLKEQLQMEDDAFIEPQNFFQALKVMARNKRRCQKSIHFNDSNKKNSEGDVHVCQFRRRRLFSASTKSSSKKCSFCPENDLIRSLRSFTRNSDITTSTKKLTTITITESSENINESSQMSLEVYGFDYEPKLNKKLPKEKNDKDTVLSAQSSHSPSEHDFNVHETMLKYSDSGTSSMLASNSHVATKHGLRSLSRLIE